MRKDKIIYFLFSFAVLDGIFFPCFSQGNETIGKVSISSPTAASLGKYGDIPISYHTGIPDISVPIYTIETGNLRMPVGLSYHVSGLRVQEQASWVGAGWALEAGGVITRTVIGAPDDRGLTTNTNKGYFSDYGYDSYLFSPGPATCAVSPAVCPVGRTGMPSNTNAPQDSYFQTCIFDGEPDLYFFNFNGHSGKFYFNDDRTPVIVPEQDLKIIPIYPGTDWRGITGFIIITPDGTNYYFGKNQNGDSSIDAIEVTYDISTQSSYTGQGATSSWYLNKIVSADGVFTITLIYTAESYSYYTTSMYPIPSVRNPNMFAYTWEYDLVKNFIDGVRLSQIKFANGEIDFAPGSLRQDLGFGKNSAIISDVPNNDVYLGARSLGSISIKTNNFCKKDSLFTSYFFDNTPLSGGLFTVPGSSLANITSDQYRLRLDSIQEISCDNTLQVPPYKFTYYTGTVPRKLSFGIDHWGFYNGVNINTGLIPTYTITQSSNQPGGAVTTISGADRDTHWPGSLGGSLEQITYPTGGNTNFVYESNSLYTNKTTTSLNFVIGLVAHIFGQSNTSQTLPLTANGTYQIAFSNATTYSANLIIEDASNNIVQNISVGNNSSLNTSVTLPSGNYQLTLSIPTYDTLSGGAQVTFSQWQTTSSLITIPVGGLRIKTITTNDAITSNNMVTSYGYNYGNITNGQSSGVLYSIPVYVQALRNDAWATVNDSCSSIGCFNCYGSNAAYYQSPSSIRPMATTQGNHIGYGEVTVSQTGNGYTRYQYYSNNGIITGPGSPVPADVCVRNLVTFCDPDIPNSPAPPIPFDPMRGELASEYQYNQNGQLIKSKSFYPTFKFDSLTTPGIISRFFVTGYARTVGPINALTVDPDAPPGIGTPPLGIETFTEYTLQSAKKVSDSVVTQTYDPVSGIFLTDAETTYYGSNFHHQPTQTLTYSSKGERLVSNIKSAFDYRISNFNIPDSLNLYYNNVNGDLNYLSTAIAAITRDQYYYWNKLNVFMNYRYMKAIDRQSYIAYRRRTFSDPGSIYTADHNIAKTAADQILQPILQLQDEYINAPIETNSWKDLNLQHAAFTEYANSTIPSGFAYPGTIKLVNLPAPSPSFTNSAVSTNTVSLDSRYLDETTLKFASGNPQQINPHDGVAISYIWDYVNTEPIAKVTNATVDQIAYTSFEADGTGNWTVTSNVRDGTTAITGLKSYNLSNGYISAGGLISGNKYIVSYWSNNGSYLISGGTVVTKTGRSTGSWIYYEHSVTMTSSSLTKTGSGNIDELRLYPLGSQMTSYTYQPTVGITTMNDPNSEITYYEYDGLSRLKNVKDYLGNIIKNYQYNYPNPNTCGANCFILRMETLSGTNTLSYPVGVFNVNGKLLGNATSQSQYVTTWMSDTADSHTGTIVAGADSVYFNFTVNAGRTVPSSVTGCRYYQYDLHYNKIDAIRNSNGVYVDYGDGTGMRLGITTGDSNVVRAPNTIVNVQTGSFGIPFIYWIHSYPDTSMKTITFYHNDASENMALDNAFAPATSLTLIRNLRGNLPQNTTFLDGDCTQQSSVFSLSGVTNWNSINTVTSWGLFTGDEINPCLNISYPQDFMTNNTNLKSIITNNRGYYLEGYEDTTFKISRLKSNWNTYFTNLTTLDINDDHWNREDLTALTNLSGVAICASNLHHSYSQTNNPLVPIPVSVLDNIINQIAAGAGQTVINGTINLNSAGTSRSSASDSSIILLKSKGWTITINGVNQ